MNVLTISYSIFIGVMSSALIISLVLYLKRIETKINLTQILIFAITILYFFSIIAKQTVSQNNLADYIYYTKLQNNYEVIIYMLLVCLISLLTNYKSYLILIVIELVFLSFVVINYFAPYGIYISKIEHLQTLHLPWNENIVSGIGFKEYINFVYFVIAQILLYFYFINAIIYGFAKGNKENSIFLLKSLIIPACLFLFTNLFFVLSSKGISISDFILDCGYFTLISSFGIRNIIGIFKANEVRSALKQNELKFRSLFDNSNDSIFIINLNNKIVDCNATSINLFGCKRGELIGSKIIRFIPEIEEDPVNWKEQFIQKVNNAFHEQPQQFECSFQTATNKLFYAEVKLNKLFLEGISYLQVIIVDTTAKHDVEKKLKDIENKFNIITKYSTDVIWIRDLNLKLKYVSPSYFRLLGYTAEEAYSLPMDTFFTTDGLNKIKNIVKSELDNESIPGIDPLRIRIIEVPQICKNGSVIWTETISCFIRDDHGNPSGIIGVTRDISERRKSEVQLREKSIVIESSITAMIICDMTGSINYANNAFVEMLGFISSGDVIGKNIFSFAGNMSKANIAFANLIKNGYNNGELELVKKDGTHFMVDLRSNLYENEFNEPTAIMFSCIDITERKIWEETMREKNVELERMNAEKDKFFSILAHDLKSPFNGFLGFTKMMAEATDDFSGEELKEIAVKMRHSATNIYKLLENLLDWSLVQRKAIKFDPTIINIKSLLEENIEIIKHWSTQKEITIRLTDEDDVYIFADLNMINTVIRNFFSNAVKYSYRGGEIKVSCKASPDKKMVIVGVKDNGIGISKENIANLFRLDIKTSTAGTENEVSTGLGLVVCKEFIQKHIGKIWIESQPGLGTTAFFSLPISDSE